jgi:hypothetical protein
MMPKVSAYYAKKQRDGYRKSVSTVDEVWSVLSQYPHANTWLGPRSPFGSTSVHHIMGRGPNPRFHWFCNLVVCSDLCHAYGHDQRPYVLELCCLHAKMRQEKILLAEDGLRSSECSEWIWHPTAMAENIHRPTLSHRIEELLIKTAYLPDSGILQTFGCEILDFLNE